MVINVLKKVKKKRGKPTLQLSPFIFIENLIKKGELVSFEIGYK